MSLPDPALSPLNFIYACSVCCRSFADVYEGHSETVQGLSDGINRKQRLVTRVWLASCCHVFCSSHMVGGGPSFHPEAQRPSDPCPVCIREISDNTPRDLYSIRGFYKDEHDPLIPSNWFNAPPEILDGRGKDAEALRFQYLALVRYCQNTYSTRKPLQDALSHTEKESASLKELASEQNDKILRLKLELEKSRITKSTEESTRETDRIYLLEQELEQFHRLNINPIDLIVFQQNKAEITKYLKLIPNLVEQNRKMKERLASLGFAIPLEPVPNLRPIDLDALEDPAMSSLDVWRHIDIGMQSPHRNGLHLVSNLRRGRMASSPAFNGTLKRQRLGSPLLEGSQSGPSSRTQMPPPFPKSSRMSSIRRLFPSIRRNATNDTTTAPVQEGHISLTTYNGEQPTGGRSMKGLTTINDNEAHSGKSGFLTGAFPNPSKPAFKQAQTEHGLFRNNTGYNQHQSMPRTLPGVDSQKLHTDNNSKELHSQPSYIRIMDGLSWDDSIELGLNFPQIGTMSAPKLQSASYRRSRSWLHSFADDQEKGSMTRSLRSPCADHGASQSYSPAQRTVESYIYNQRPAGFYQKRNRGPIVPRPRSRQSKQAMDAVVNRCLHSGGDSNLPSTGSRPPEPNDNSTHCRNYKSQAPQMTRHLTSHNCLSLNGLSFFDKPLDAHNQPISYTLEDRYEDYAQ